MPRSKAELAKWESGRNLGAELLQSVTEMCEDRAIRHTEVAIPAPAEVRARVGMSQVRFAQLLGVSARTLQQWEQGRRQPSGSARTVLRISARHPEVLRELMLEG